MASECPHCDAPLEGEGAFCHACGWEYELQVAEWTGDATELPDDDHDYERFLAREGLDGAGAPWGKLLAIVLGLGLLLLLALGGLRLLGLTR